jgi:hypothetical protein
VWCRTGAGSCSLARRGQLRHRFDLPAADQAASSPIDLAIRWFGHPSIYSMHPTFLVIKSEAAMAACVNFVISNVDSLVFLAVSMRFTNWILMWVMAFWSLDGTVFWIVLYKWLDDRKIQISSLNFLAELAIKFYCDFVEGPLWIQTKLMREMEGWVVNEIEPAISVLCCKLPLPGILYTYLNSFTFVKIWSNNFIWWHTDLNSTLLNAKQGACYFFREYWEFTFWKVQRSWK